MSAFLVIAHLRLWDILPENGEEFDYIGILHDVNGINDGCAEVMAAFRHTISLNWLPVPSKQRMRVRG